MAPDKERFLPHVMSSLTRLWLVMEVLNFLFPSHNIYPLSCPMSLIEFHIKCQGYNTELFVLLTLAEQNEALPPDYCCVKVATVSSFLFGLKDFLLAYFFGWWLQKDDH